MARRPSPYFHESVLFGDCTADDTDSDTFEIAILTVNRNEKLIKTKCSRVVSFDNLKWPRNMSM